jgi:hypothetical protein
MTDVIRLRSLTIARTRVRAGQRDEKHAPPAIALDVPLVI